MKLSVVAFDMDGVVLNSIPVLKEIAVHTIQQLYNMPVQEAEKRYLDTLGMPFQQQLETIFPADKRNSMAAVHYESRHMSVYEKIPVVPGIPDLFNLLKSKHLATALVTSTDHSIVRTSVPHVLALGFDFVGGYKKDFDKTAQLTRASFILGKRPEEILFVSDSLNDSIHADNVGATFELATCETVIPLIKKVFQ